jgi:hypothetical protein
LGTPGRARADELTQFCAFGWFWTFGIVCEVDFFPKFHDIASCILRASLEISGCLARTWCKMVRLLGIANTKVVPGNGGWGLGTGSSNAQRRILNLPLREVLHCSKLSPGVLGNRCPRLFCGFLGEMPSCAQFSTGIVRSTFLGLQVLFGAHRDRPRDAGGQSARCQVSGFGCQEKGVCWMGFRHSTLNVPQSACRVRMYTYPGDRLAEWVAEN